MWDGRMKQRIRTWVTFLKDVAADGRIPTRNKAILAGMLLYIASPVDLIPDFIPIIGYFDDLIVILLMLDYVLNEIPLHVLADHYPGDAESLLGMRRRTRWIGRCIPGWVKRKLWKPVGKGPRTGSENETAG